MPPWPARFLRRIARAMIEDVVHPGEEQVVQQILHVGQRLGEVLLQPRAGFAADELLACQAGGLPVYLVRTPDEALQAIRPVR